MIRSMSALFAVAAIVGLLGGCGGSYHGGSADLKGTWIVEREVVDGNETVYPVDLPEDGGEEQVYFFAGCKEMTTFATNKAGDVVKAKLVDEAAYTRDGNRLNITGEDYTCDVTYSIERLASGDKLTMEGTIRSTGGDPVKMATTARRVENEKLPGRWQIIRETLAGDVRKWIDYETPPQEYWYKFEYGELMDFCKTYWDEMPQFRHISEDLAHTLRGNFLVMAGSVQDGDEDKDLNLLTVKIPRVDSVLEGTWQVVMESEEGGAPKFYPDENPEDEDGFYQGIPYFEYKAGEGGDYVKNVFLKLIDGAFKEVEINGPCLCSVDGDIMDIPAWDARLKYAIRGDVLEMTGVFKDANITVIALKVPDSEVEKIPFEE